jgi:hypothetical protein
MHAFRGDLLIGGLAVKNLDGILEEGSNDNPEPWAGQFQVDPCQQDVLETGRQYLLILDDGRNREVVLTDIHEGDEGSVVCEFQDCVQMTKPR